MSRGAGRRPWTAAEPLGRSRPRHAGRHNRGGLPPLEVASCQRQPGTLEAYASGVGGARPLPAATRSSGDGSPRRLRWAAAIWSPTITATRTRRAARRPRAPGRRCRSLRSPGRRPRRQGGAGRASRTAAAGAARARAGRARGRDTTARISESGQLLGRVRDHELVADRGQQDPGDDHHVQVGVRVAGEQRPVRRLRESALGDRRDEVEVEPPERRRRRKASPKATTCAVVARDRRWSRR